MPFTRFGLQSKIIIIIAAAVVVVVGVSTYIAMLLTRVLVDEEIYNKALVQARAAARQLANQGGLESSDPLLRLLRQIEHDLPGVRQADVYRHDADHSLAASTAPTGPHMELDRTPGIQNYFEFEPVDEDTITIETPDGQFWIIGTTIREQGRTLGCLNLKVSKSRSSLVTQRLVARNLLLPAARAQPDQGNDPGDGIHRERAA
jgi:hypothetical protein